MQSPPKPMPQSALDRSGQALAQSPEHVHREIAVLRCTLDRPKPRCWPVGTDLLGKEQALFRPLLDRSPTSSPGLP